MKHKKILATAVLTGTMMVSGTAFAADIPDVSRADYRYYLEDYAWDYVEKGEYAYHTDEELKALLNETLAKDNTSYPQLVKEKLQDEYHYTAGELNGHTENELEKLLAYEYMQQQRKFMKDMLQEYYNTDVDIERYTSLELLEIYYEELLQQDYQVTAELNGKTGYEMASVYDRTGAIHSLQERYGVDVDFDKYTLDELRDMGYWYIYSEQLRENWGVQEDLSAYTGEELETLVSKYRSASVLKEQYNIEVDINDYTAAELSEWRNRLDTEKALRGMGVTEDLSDYRNDEVQRLWLERSWEKVIGDDTDLSQYDNEALYKLYLEKSTELLLGDLLAEKEQMKVEKEAAKAEKLKIRVNGALMYLPDEEKGCKAIGYLYESPEAAVIENGRCYLPCQALADALRAEAVFDDKTDNVTMKKGDYSMQLQIGNSECIMNNNRAIMDAVPFIQHGEIYIPVRPIAEALGADIQWDDASNTMYIRY